MNRLCAGFDALIVPSAAGDDHNLVIFKDLRGDDETATIERIEPVSEEPQPEILQEVP